jgi:hypothetical protein
MIFREPNVPDSSSKRNKNPEELIGGLRELPKEVKVQIEPSESEFIAKITVPSAVSYARMVGNNFESFQIFSPDTPIAMDNRTTDIVTESIMDTDVVEVKKDDGRREVLMFSIPNKTIEKTVSQLKTEVVPNSAEFNVGDKNETSAILSSERIGALSVQDLEERMRPLNDSMQGFMGENESLLEILAYDNELVRQSGLTHEQLAKPLSDMRQMWREAYSQGNEEVEVEYGGTKYLISGTSWRGMQESPFQDEAATNIDLAVTNLSNGRTIEFSGLLPDMIANYGFYEGRGTQYRLEPGQIAAVFEKAIRQEMPTAQDVI